MMLVKGTVYSDGTFDASRLDPVGNKRHLFSRDPQHLPVRDAGSIEQGVVHRGENACHCLKGHAQQCRLATTADQHPGRFASRPAAAHIRSNAWRRFTRVDG